MDRAPARGPAPAPSPSRDKILVVAEVLFARRGFAGVGMQEVADAAGLGKSSLFHHFRAKAQLYLAVIERVLESLEQRLASCLDAPGDAGMRLDRWLDGLIDALVEDPPAARLLLRALFEDDDFDAEAWPEGAAAQRRLEGILSGIGGLLRQGRARGEFRRVSTAHTIQSLIGATVYHFASGEVGEGVLGAPIFSAQAVARRKRELARLLDEGLAAPARVRGGE